MKKEKEKVLIVPADQGSAEDVLGFTPEEARDITIKTMDEFVDRNFPEVNEPTFEFHAPVIERNQVAAIPAVDRDVDAPTVRGPIDIRVGDGCHVKNPA